jgi:hypothetical protein
MQISDTSENGRFIFQKSITLVGSIAFATIAGEYSIRSNYEWKGDCSEISATEECGRVKP